MRLVFDIEANGLYDEADTIWCICAEDLDTGEKYEWNWRPIQEQKKTDTKPTGMPWLTDAQELIGHNIVNYDLPLLKKLWNWEPNEYTKITDTLVMSRLSNPDRPKPSGYTYKGGPHSLESWGYRVGKSKPHHEDWHVFSPDMLQRCREDVGINVLTYHSIRSEFDIDDWDWTRALEIEHKIAKIISAQEHYGIYFDKDKAEGYVEELTHKIDEIDRELLPSLPCTIKQRGTAVLAPFTTCGEHSRRYREDISYCSGPFCRVDIIPFDLGSTQQVKDYLLSHGWKPENWNRSKLTGELTSPKLEGNFEGIEGNLPHKVKERLTWRHRRSQIEGWLSNLRPDQTLVSGANSCGTNTGRMIPYNVVNIPKAKESVPFGKEMRSLFIARKGYSIVGHDASGIELRMLAHYMGDPNYTEAILKGDIHEFNRRAAGLPDRDAAKTFIYAFIYGAGNSKLGAIIGGSDEDGKRLREQFLRSLPHLEKLINRVKRESGKGYLKGLDGRKVRMRRDDRGRIKRYTALNVLLQSSDAIVMKQSCIDLWDAVETNGIVAHKVLDMHDEGQSEVRPGDVELYSTLAVQSIIKAGEIFNLNIPLDGEAKVGNNLSETH